MKKRPWHVWPIVLFVGFMYVMKKLCPCVMTQEQSFFVICAW